MDNEINSISWSYLSKVSSDEIDPLPDNCSAEMKKEIVEFAVGPGALIRLKFLLDYYNGDKEDLFEMAGFVSTQVRSSEVLKILGIPESVAAGFNIEDREPQTDTSFSLEYLIFVLNMGRLDEIYKLLISINSSSKKSRLELVIVFIYETALSLLNNNPKEALANISSFDGRRGRN